MFIDTRSLSPEKTIESDVCIVGAGTAGLTVAKSLINQHFDVCLIESGGLKPDRETQALYKGEKFGHPYFGLDSARARYFGGSTNRWHICDGENCSLARMRPFDKIDFEHRDWVPYSGWPFDKAHLDPYYERAQNFCKITPASYDVEDWSDPKESPPIHLSGGRTQTVIFKFGSRLPFLNEYAEAIDQSVNITTYLYANVIEINMAETGETVKGLTVACLNGATHQVTAKLFILATGAIEIPRLLLTSRNICQDGVGNRNDLVGRFFMEHPHFWLGFYLPSRAEVFESMGLYAGIHKFNGVPIVGKISPTEDVLRQERLLNHVVEFVPRVSLATFFDQFLIPRVKSDSVHAFLELRSALKKGHLPKPFWPCLAKLISGIDDIYVTAFRNLKKRLRRITCKKRVKYFILAHMCEQAPNPNSRVFLGKERDRLGMLRANLDWQMTSQDLDSPKRCQEILDEALRREGLGYLISQLDSDTPPERITGGYHHMGTTRMHNDPKQGVVDGNCRVHGVDNLYIAGPSVFPTGGYANPSLTTVALALRLSDHIRSIYNNQYS